MEVAEEKLKRRKQKAETINGHECTRIRKMEAGDLNAEGAQNRRETQSGKPQKKSWQEN